MKKDYLKKKISGIGNSVLLVFDIKLLFTCDSNVRVFVLKFKNYDFI